jgi:hypothetical protein
MGAVIINNSFRIRRKMKKLICAILILSVSSITSADGAVQMAIWDFGPNTQYFTTQPTTENVIGTPTLELFGGILDPNGKNGVDYTDIAGINHIAGQAAAWDEIYVIGNSAMWIVTIDTVGWKDLGVRFDYKAWNSKTTSFGIDYRLSDSEPWINILNNALIIPDKTFHSFTYSLSGVTEINNQPVVELRFSGFDKKGSGKLAFDNFELMGTPTPIRVNQFGNLNGRNVSSTLMDVNGTYVTFKLTGAGFGEVIGGANFDEIMLFGTDANSRLTISSKGRTETSIGDIIVYGSLKRILAGTTNLRGNITVTGSLGTLILNDIADDHIITIGPSANPKAAVAMAFDQVRDLTIDSNMPIRLISATEWLGGSIRAPSIFRIKTKGDKKRTIAGDLDVNVIIDGSVNIAKAAGTLSGEWSCNSIKRISCLDAVEANFILSQIPDVRIPALGRLTAAEWICSTQIISAGNIGIIKAGAMENSICFAGIAEGITGLPVAEVNSFDGIATIRRIAVKGIRGETPPYFINSDIAAAKVLYGYIVEPQSDNNDVPFGLFADYFKKLAIRKNDGKTVLLRELQESKDSQTIDGVEIRLY